MNEVVLRREYLAGVAQARDQLEAWNDHDVSPEHVSRDWQAAMLSQCHETRAGFADAMAAYVLACMKIGAPRFEVWNPLDDLGTPSRGFLHGRPAEN